METKARATRAIWTFAVTQTLGYACFYYIFAALVVYWADDLGWSKPQLAMGPTFAIVVSGALAPVMGRLIDQGYARFLLTWGSVFGAGALLFLAQAETRFEYLAAWTALGVAQAAALYEVCFALIVRRMGDQARAAIVRVTLVAGFASTLAFPAAAFLSDAFGWRAAVYVAAVIALVFIAPMNFYAAHALRQGELTLTDDDKAAQRSALRSGLRSMRFWVLGMVLALLSLNHWMMISFIIPLFTDLGATAATAVFAASIVGPAQVFGRFVLMRFETSVSNGVVMTLCLAAMFGGVVSLVASGAYFPLVFGFAILQGGAIGVMTILRPILIADVMGKQAYGAIAGSIQVLPLLAAAAAPLIGGILFGVGGASAMIAASAGILVLGTAGTLLLRRVHH